MSSVYGQHLKLTVFGQSHALAIGMALDGIPAGLPVDLGHLQDFLARRAPGQGDYATPRNEADQPRFLSGLVDGRTCGAPIAAVIENTNTRSGDYSDLKDHPRPGHADYTAQIKYGGYQDVAGGGHFSGRLTAPLCIAGGLCLQFLEAQGIRIGAHLYRVGGVPDRPFDPMHPEIAGVDPRFPTLDPAAGEEMRRVIAQARSQGDSVGGIIECAVTGLPAGLGDPMFLGMENRIAAAVFGVPAVKGIEFGAGFASADLLGSENNDPFRVVDGAVQTASNHAGGILGGITSGMPLIFRAAVKPTPSIAKKQETVSLSARENADLVIRGRHDPCIAPRAVPVIEAAAALAVYDAFLSRKCEL